MIPKNAICVWYDGTAAETIKLGAGIRSVMIEL
jgi:hypothetical protein